MERNSAEEPIVNMTACGAVLMQTTAGLEYIHSKNIVHHDIKVCRDVQTRYIFP